MNFQGQHAYGRASKVWKSRIDQSRVQTDTRTTGSSSQQLTKSEAAANRAKKKRENRVAKRSQEELADFKEPGTNEGEPNLILAHFEEETRRKPR
jgi:hypothetical protein